MDEIPPPWGKGRGVDVGAEVGERNAKMRKKKKLKFMGEPKCFGSV